MTEDDKPRYNQVLHRKMATLFDPGEELHLLTQDAFGMRMLNLRICRVAPSRSGHTGYTKRGFFLSREEAEILKEHLIDMLEDEGLFDPLPDGLKEVEDTVGGA
tara:strand:- start:1364 stop:1675 length:312 start_codon:yes stop_codon:yes gene_type:complete